MNEQEMQSKRSQLIEYISGFALKSPAIKKAFSSVKRENFVQPEMQPYAYDDNALPISGGQTISQPSTIAIMLELLNAQKGMKVLEIGSGCGYVAALLSRIVGEKGGVFGIEISRGLAEKSRAVLGAEGVKNCEIKNSDGASGWAEHTPFDRIIISCACPFIPKELFAQLKEGGRIVAPVGDEHTQLLEIMMKEKGKPLKKTYEGSVFAFVPMKGRSGFG